jgi:hypothetical protein
MSCLTEDSLKTTFVDAGSFACNKCLTMGITKMEVDITLLSSLTLELSPESNVRYLCKTFSVDELQLDPRNDY